MARALASRSATIRALSSGKAVLNTAQPLENNDNTNINNAIDTADFFMSAIRMQVPV